VAQRVDDADDLARRRTILARMCLVDLSRTNADAPRGANARPRRVGLVLATLASTAIMASAGGLAYLVNSGDAPGLVQAARQEQAVAAPLRVRSVTLAAGSATATGAGAVRITFSAPIAANSAMPRLRPAARGDWQVSGSVLTFIPNGPLAPATRFRLHIAAGESGIRGTNGGLLARPVVTSFRTHPYSSLRLAQLLGGLGYLPLSWRPAAMGRVAGQAHASRTAQQALAYSPPAGTFTWHPGYPARLRSLWRSGWSGPVVRGAVMAFQAQHGLAINGVPGPRLWRALFTAADKGERNTAGYTYAIASEGSPETLTIWHDGRVVVRSLANTGIAVAPAVPGTFPVYRRLRNTVMSETNPDGTRYTDPVSFVSYFNGKDAVRYFRRGSYGWPQSLGCVELPYQAAARAYPFLTYGSLVTIIG
jgi:peptidoglycan hydrolase-like protein with peptidoglycan-binding domain